MKGLPKGWTFAPIDSLATKPSQRVPDDDATFIYVDIGSVSRDSKRVVGPQQLLGKNAPSRARQVLKAGDVLVSMTRPNLNAVALVGNDLDGQIASTGFDVLRSLGVEPRWLFAAVRSKKFVDSMSGLVQGALYPAVRPSDVRAFEIPVAPLPEQIRISDKLDDLLSRVDATRDRLDRIPELLGRLRQSVLAAAAGGELTDDFRKGKDRCWKSVLLGDVASGFSYGSASKSSISGEVPVLRMGNIQSGALDWDDLVFTSDAEEIAKYKLFPGDVLFNRTNSPELVGKTAVFNGERDAIFAGYLIRIRCSDDILPDFVGYCLNSPSGRHWCWEVKTDGVSQSNINAKKLAAFDLALPPLDEQREIVRRVQSLFELIEQVKIQCDAARARVRRLTAALLEKAFRGELAHQDSSDEPAAELLARLKTAQSNTAPKRRVKLKKAAEKGSSMSTDSKSALRSAIAELTSSRFSFDELASKVSGDYESVKVALFELLEEPRPVVRQVFDKRSKAMKLERVRQ